MGPKIYVLIVLCIFIGYALLFSQTDKNGLEDQHKRDYVNKACVELNIGERFAESLYDHKINLNAHKEFKKIGIDLRELAYKLAGGKDFKENALESDLVIVGTVLQKEYDSNKKAYFRSTFTVRTEDVLLGEDLYNPIPDQITIKRESSDSSHVSYEVGASNIGDKYIFFLTRGWLMHLKRWLGIMSNDEVHSYFGSYDFPSEEVLDNKYVFTEMPYSGLRVTSALVYDRFGDELQPSFDLTKKIIKQIEKINDRKNFKNRDYKIEKKGGK